MQINNLESYRYSITKLDNDVIQLGSKIAMAATYENLIAEHENRLRTETRSLLVEQIIKNHRSALRAFLKFIDKTEASAIGVEFTTGFDSAVRLHLETSDIKAKSQTDRRSLLSKWRDTYELIKPAENTVQISSNGQLLQRRTPEKHGPSYFQKGLLNALKAAKLAPRRAAVLAGLSTSAIQRWTKGALPNVKTYKALNELDRVLNLPDGELSRLYEKTTGKLESVDKNEFRERHKTNTADHYRLQIAQLTPDFLVQWRAFFDYKTTPYSRTLVRHLRGQWTLAHEKVSAITATSINSKGNTVCASAQVYWTHISSFFGFLQLSTEKNGWGLAATQAQTLAWLAVPEALESYLFFLMQRSDGLRHTGHKVFCQQVIALTGESGYLKQCPEFESSLPQKFLRKRSWAEICKESRDMCSAWKSQSTDMSRDPMLPIKPLLNLDEPLVPVIGIMSKLRLTGDAAPRHSIAEAIARRDELLIGLLVSNPLRAKNIITLTYNADNSGNVYRSKTGEWHLRFPSSRFKNGKKMGRAVYDVHVANWLTELFTEYVRDFRPLLVKDADPGFFFLGENGLKFKTLNRHVFELTLQHIPGCAGFGPHAFRHLIATDWLKKHPNDFYTVAELLNDSFQVVMSTYAHLKKDLAFSRYEKYINALR